MLPRQVELTSGQTLRADIDFLNFVNLLQELSRTIAFRIAFRLIENADSDDRRDKKSKLFALETKLRCQQRSIPLQNHPIRVFLDLLCGFATVTTMRLTNYSIAMRGNFMQSLLDVSDHC